MATNQTNNTTTKADQLAQIQQRIFEREVDEELRQERLAEFWKKYKFFIIGGAIWVVLITMAHEWYLSWQLKTRSSESDRLEQALILSVKGDDDAALAQLQQLGAEGKTGYRSIAKLEEAGLYFRQNQQNKALTTLKALADDSKTPDSLRDLAVVSYVGHSLDTGNTADLKQMIKPLINKGQGAFYGQAVELMVWLHLISGEQAEAQDLFAQAKNSDYLGPQVKERLTLLLEQKK